MSLRNIGTLDRHASDNLPQPKISVAGALHVASAQRPKGRVRTILEAGARGALPHLIGAKSKQRRVSDQHLFSPPQWLPRSAFRNFDPARR
jgi:hypothetical protein